VKSLRKSHTGPIKKEEKLGSDEFSANFTVIPVDPQTYPPCFIFKFEEKDYPAMLMNIPTPVEALKTYDNKVFHKSGDIGQILQVFRDEQERDEMRAQLVTEPHDLYYPHGLTAPTENVVKHRFDATRINENFLTFRYQEVLADVIDFSMRSGGNLIPSTKISENSSLKMKLGDNDNDGKDESPEDSLPYYETILEEVLDYEEYMMDVMNPGHGRTIEFDGMNWTDEMIELVAQHPEIIWSRLEEEDDILEQQAKEMLRNKKVNKLTYNTTDAQSALVSSAAAGSTGADASAAMSMESLLLKFKKNASGTGIELENTITENAEQLDWKAGPAAVVEQSSMENDQSSIQNDTSRAAAMMSVMLDGEGEDAEEGEGEEEKVAEAEEVVAVKNEEREEEEEMDEGEENMEDTNWMDDL
jgi:hypothetical protein